MSDIDRLTNLLDDFNVPYVLDLRRPDEDVSVEFNYSAFNFDPEGSFLSCRPIPKDSNP